MRNTSSSTIVIFIFYYRLVIYAGELHCDDDNVRGNRHQSIIHACTHIRVRYNKNNKYSTKINFCYLFFYFLKTLHFRIPTIHRETTKQGYEKRDFLFKTQVTGDLKYNYKRSGKKFDNTPGIENSTILRAWKTSCVLTPCIVKRPTTITRYVVTALEKKTYNASDKRHFVIDTSVLYCVITILGRVNEVFRLLFGT